MLIKLALAGILVAFVFLAYVSTRRGEFRYARSGAIHAPASRIYPYISDFKKAHAWNPYDQKDPAMKRSFSGPEGQVGSVMVFDGNKDVGAGSLEIIKLIPDQAVEIRLRMTRPFRAENLVRYTLAPEGAGTRFTWSLEGDGGFMAKLMSLFLDCEQMVAGDLEKGVAQLKAVSESH